MCEINESAHEPDPADNLISIEGSLMLAKLDSSFLGEKRHEVVLVKVSELGVRAPWDLRTHHISHIFDRLALSQDAMTAGGQG